MPKLFAPQVPILAAASFVAAAVLTGCAGFATTAADTNSLGAASGAMTGRVHGGNQPVSGADVRLYAAGTTGYGSAPTLFAVTTSASDGFGSFSFTKTPGAGATTTPVYGCPTASDPQMYVVAKGGNTQGTGNGANTAAAFIAAVGPCSTIGSATYVDLNEITTVATMAALQQYFAPGNATTDNNNHLGYPNTTQAQQGFANGVATIANLANIATGTIAAPTLTATPAGSTTAASVVVTPETAKINTLADILAACVNTTSNTSTACATLFTNATPPNSAVTSQPALTFGTATDTLQALYYMLTNPTSGAATNITNLFNLAAANPPFLPTSASAPTDWTVGIKYSSTSACTAGTFLNAPYHLASDSTGNIWIAGGSTNGNLMEVSPNGTPLTCALGTAVASSKSLALDVNGNVWIASGTTANLYKYVPSSATSTAWPTLNIPYVVAADASGNVFYTAVTGTEVAKFTGAAASATPTVSTQIATVSSAPFFIAIDTAGSVYTANSAASAAGSLLYVSYPSTATGNTGGYNTVSNTTNICNPYGVSIGLINKVNVSNSNYAACTTGSPNSFTAQTATNGVLTPAVASATYAGGQVAPRENAVDGAGNVWAPNSTAATTNYVTSAASTSFAVTEFSATGVALSPTGNTTTVSVSGGFQKDSTIYSGGLRSVAIDPTGNVWIGLNSASTTATASISEIVGAAVPVVTPISSALLAGATTTNAVVKP